MIRTTAQHLQKASKSTTRGLISVKYSIYLYIYLSISVFIVDNSKEVIDILIHFTIHVIGNEDFTEVMDKSYCDSTPGLTDEELSKSISGPESNWGCISLPEDKTPQRQTGRKDSYSKELPHERTPASGLVSRLKAVIDCKGFAENGNFSFDYVTTY